MNTRSIARTFVRYAIIGVTQNAAFYLLTLAVIAFGFAAWQAALVLYPLGVVVSFTANRNWTFDADIVDDRTRQQFWRYVLIYVVTYPVVVALNYVQESFGVPSWLAPIFTMGLITVGLFAALRRWVFRPARDSRTIMREMMLRRRVDAADDKGLV
jgi:putative flippase GtrA